MNALLAALLLAAAPPAPAQKAKELAAQKAWEELYLAYSAGDGAGVPEAQRRVISGALNKGCQALLEEDTVMAYSLGERAVVYEASAPALKCLARAARKTDQRAAAEAALRKGMASHPKDGGFGLELGKLLLEEQDPAGAVAVLELVPKRSREAAEAKRLMQQARSLVTQEGSARVEAGRIERQLHGAATARGSASQEAEAVPALALESTVDSGPSGPRPTTLSYQSRVDDNGIRTRENSRFVISYFNNNRDFRDRANYEGLIVQALDDAYHTTRELLGEARESSMKVVLYTQPEYRAVFGSYADTTAGMYRNGAMRINDAAKMTPSNKATIVHEYVHATIAEICAGRVGGTGDEDMLRLPGWFNEGVAEYVEWRYLRQDGPDPRLMTAVQHAAEAGVMPTLKQLSRVAPINTPNPPVAYAVSAMAVRELVRQSGMNRVIHLVRDVCRSRMSFEDALREHFGKTLEDLDREVLQALPSR